MDSQQSSAGNDPVADALIIGQGIAGSLLAYVLHKRGLRVYVVDDGHKTSASVVAAGMINPIQGQRLNLIWEAEQTMPAALALYRELETHFGTQFFFPQTILKLLKNAEQAQILQQRLQEPAFAPYIGAAYPPDNHAADTLTEANPVASSSEANAVTDSCAAETPPAAENRLTEASANTLAAPFGSFEIRGGGYLDTRALLATLRDYFRAEGLLISATFSHSDLDLHTADTVRWQQWQARHIIFAEGWRILENPLFTDYAFFSTKGQILSVQSQAALPRYVINRGHWLVPQGEREAWAGATYERGLTDSTTTDEAEHEILSQIQEAIPNNRLSAQSRRAGIRLATPDYIPRLGFLPADARIGLFTAFSSKGNCLAPYLAERMAAYLLEGEPLPPRADISIKKPAAQSRQVLGADTKA